MHLVDSQHILVIGAGRSGLAATKFLAHYGHRVTLYDDNTVDKLRYLRDANISPTDGIAFCLGEQPDLSSITTLVLSPGVDLRHPLITWAREKNLPILSEVDVGALMLPNKKLIGITGTNGKSTTTVMVEQIFNHAGIKAIACGNLGRAFCDVLLHDAEHFDYFVLELSSFQLEASSHLRLDGAIIINITPDHLDRHKNFADYQAAKLKIKDLLKANAPLVVNRHLSDTITLDARTHYFSGAMFGHDDFSFLKELSIRGEHNYENAVAAAMLSQCLGISNSVIAHALKQFNPLPHRCEIVAAKDGLIFVNDSKGTTVEAVKRALATFSEPIHLLLGGIAKGEDFGQLREQIFPHVKGFYVYGRDQNKIISDLNSPLANSFVDLKAAVHSAKTNSHAGDIILLSPGCASYDQFDDYQHRGETFRELAKTI